MQAFSRGVKRAIRDSTKKVSEKNDLLVGTQQKLKRPIDGKTGTHWEENLVIDPFQNKRRAITCELSEASPARGGIETGKPHVVLVRGRGNKQDEGEETRTLTIRKNSRAKLIKRMYRGTGQRELHSSKRNV